MNTQFSKYPVMVFRTEFEGKVFYKVGLSKKDQNGNYINGYKEIKFKKGIELNDKTKIQIKNWWLDFYLKEKRTVDYIFCNDFEIVGNDLGNKTQSFKLDEIELNDNDLPF